MKYLEVIFNADASAVPRPPPPAFALVHFCSTPPPPIVRTSFMEAP